MWRNLPWSIAVLLLGFPYPQTSSRFLQDVALPPAQFWPDYYNLYSPPPPAPIYYLSSPPPAKTPFRFSSLLLALPVGSVVLLFIFTYVRSLCKQPGGTASLPASIDGSSAASTWEMQGNLPANDDPQGGHTDRSYINKLPTLFFSEGKKVGRPHEKGKRHSHGEQMKKKSELYNTCAVCLSEYEEGETLKRLPACGHLFHKGCIDMWLFSHSTCPLCRLSLFDHKGDLILHGEGEEALLDLEHAISTSTPYVPPLSSLVTRSHSSNEQSSMLGTTVVNMAHGDHGIQRSISHPMRRDNNNNRVHPINSSS